VSTDAFENLKQAPAFSWLHKNLEVSSHIEVSFQLTWFENFIWLLAGRLIVADTNNSLIRYLDLNMEQAELQTLELKGVNPNP
jgi:hypothetical protein